MLPDVNISDAEVEFAVTSLKSVGDLPLHELQFAPYRGVKVSFRTFDREDSRARADCSNANVGHASCLPLLRRKLTHNSGSCLRLPVRRELAALSPPPDGCG